MKTEVLIVGDYVFKPDPKTINPHVYVMPGGGSISRDAINKWAVLRGDPVEKRTLKIKHRPESQVIIKCEVCGQEKPMRSSARVCSNACRTKKWKLDHGVK